MEHIKLETIGSTRISAYDTWEERQAKLRNNMADMRVYGVTVKFKEHGYWSKPYTYKSVISYEKDDIVIVPTNDFYSVGKVIACSADYQFSPTINYKEILSKVVI